MPYQLGLPDSLRKYGLQVELVPGWETRGSSVFLPRGSVNHHTGGSPKGIRPSLNVVTYGRSDLPGPLCNVFLDRNGVAVVVAAGRANHAGTGGYKGLKGNSAVFGTEAESTGLGLNPWTDAQLISYPKIIAAFADLAGQKTADLNCNHKTWAPRRKVDCANLTDEWFKVRANQILKGDDDILRDQWAKNPVSGKDETLESYIVNLEQRIVDRLKGELFRDAQVQNGYSKKNEPVGVTIGYTEPRIVDRVNAAVASLSAKFDALKAEVDALKNK